MKYFSLLLVFVLACSISSCQRTFTCICTTVDTSGSVEDLVVEEDITNSKKTATDLCESGSATFGTFVTTCVLQ